MFLFRAMNTTVTVHAIGADAAGIAARVAATFAQAEQRFSRFCATSELSRLNRATKPMVVSPELFAALVRARTYGEMTDGLFEPAVGATLVALGYDRSFDEGAFAAPPPSPVPPRGRFADLVLDPMSRRVTRPPHLQLDLGGMVKGATVDAAASHLGPVGSIDAGGDAILRGSDPGGHPWLIDIEDPQDASAVIATIAAADCSVATSAANRRQWVHGTSWAHHLIDPRTNAPAATDLLQATVTAATTELADVLAKTAFLLGLNGASRFLDGRPGVGAVLVTQDREVVVLGEVDLRGANEGIPRD